jgi:cell division protein FtsX
VIWTMIEVGNRHSAGSTTAPATLLSAGAVMSLAAVALVRLANHASTLRHHPGGGRRTPAVSLGYAYSRAAPTQTAVVCAMYAVVVFTLCFAVIVGHLYSGSVDRVARQLGGSAALEVRSNSAQPVAATDVAQLSGVTNVTRTSALEVRVQEPGDLVNDAELIGFDSSFIGHGTPPLITATPGGPTSSLYRRVLADPTLVVLGVDFNATAQNSLDHRAPRVGDQLQLEDRITGATRVVRIAALVANARYQGADHIYGSDALAAALRGPVVARNVLYVETRPGTNNDTLAAIIDGTHLANGAYARSFRRLANDLLRAQQEFLNILAGYTALALIAGGLTLAVAMTDRVRERRHQLATLRAIGLHPKTLRRALRFEGAIIGLEATLAGALAATLLAWRVATAGALGEPLTFTLPWATLAIVIIAVLFGAAAATTLAARQAGRLQPASALRADE